MTKFFLIGDFVEGTWDEVARGWCEYAGCEALCLTPYEDRADAYLVVASDAKQVEMALMALLSQPARALPLYWLSDYDGSVRRFRSLEAARRHLARLAV